jgi:GTP-binding protein HflX
MPLVPGPMLLAFNKLDCVDSESLAEAKEDYPGAAFISASQRLGLDSLRQKLGMLV